MATKHIYKFHVEGRVCRTGEVFLRCYRYAYAENEDEAMYMILHDFYKENGRGTNIKFLENCGIHDSMFELWDLVLKTPEDKKRFG